MTDLVLPGTPGYAAAGGARPMIVVDDAHVTYRVYASGKRLSARESMFSVNALRGGRGLQTVPALRGVTFTASEGETVGVIGHNGSGKSTLFRAMSGLIPTSEGTIWAADRPVLLGVNAALVPELSGENNIKLGLLAMGFTPEEAAARVDEIADFAELNEFLYHPMRTYSSGMGARLRFAIASAKAHSILLIDEALSVGDRRFKLKSEQRIRSLRDSAGLVMIVSHSVGSLRDTCERVLWIHKGELRADGVAKDVIDEYVKWTKQPGNAAVGAASTAKTTRPAPQTKARKPAPNEAKPAPVAAPATASETEAPSDLSPLEQMFAEAAVETKDVLVPPESPRDLARRERYYAAARQRRRRNLIALAITGVAILLAVGAGAAIALLANLPEPPEPPASSSESPESVDVPPPAVVSFASTAASVVCADADAESTVSLNWEVEDATRIAIAAGAVAVDAVDQPLQTDLPAVALDHAVPFLCSDETQAYTLTAESADGTRVSSVLTVARELTSESDAAPVAEERTDSRPANPGRTTPPRETAPPQESPRPEETTPPGETPAPEETTPPVETPAPEETTPPVETPAPEETAPA